VLLTPTPVLTRLLRLRRRRDLLALLAQRLHRTHQLRRLGPHHLLRPRHARHQLDREDAPRCRLLLLLRHRRGVEGETGPVSGLRAHGGRAGGQRYGDGAEVFVQGLSVEDDVYGGCERGGQWAGYAEVCAMNVGRVFESLLADAAVAVPLCYGCRRIWRMTIPTIWRSE
jgi:hypothetical protein